VGKAGTHSSAARSLERWAPLPPGRWRKEDSEIVSLTARAARSAFSILLLLAGLAACVQLAPSPPAEFAAEPRTEAIYVLHGGWHTELALSVQLIDGPLAALYRDFPAARTLVFGWGARDYYMAQHPGFADAMRALSPGPAVMLVTGLPAAPASSENAFILFVSRPGMVRLSHWLWNELAKDAAGPQRISAGPYPESVFYAATGSYDASHTCNTWTAEALRVAGLPVNAAGIIFADQVTAQLAPFATPTPALQ
jgi:uncharacterized protein (TIGR02117 family)